MSHRILAIDVGIQNTGIIIADVFEEGNVSLVHMHLFKDPNDMHASLLQYIKNTIEPLILNHASPYYVYENLFTRRFYKNPVVMRTQSGIRKLFEKTNIQIICLRPSQKFGIGGTNVNRKEQSVTTARMFLAEKQAKEWLDKFNTYERAHDVADALLSLLYLNTNRSYLVKKAKKGKTTKKCK